MVDDSAGGSKDGGAGPGGMGMAPPPAPVPKPGAKWAEPLVKVDAVWTRFEVWLAMTAFGLEVFSMALWVCLKGFSAPPDHASSTVFRAIVAAAVLGTIAHLSL